VKELLAALLVPPGNLPLIAMAGLLLRRRWPRLGAALTWASCLLLVALALPFVGESMLVALEEAVPPRARPDVKPEAIVILSADITRFGGEGPGFGSGQLSLERERAAAALFHQVQLPMLITGGVLQPGDPPIADVMAASMRDDFQIAVRWTERRSRDTWQNAEYTAPILRKEGIHSVYLVTHAWHMKRALIAFRHFGIEAVPSPLPMDRYPRVNAYYLEPIAQGWIISYYALHEWLGCAYYALRSAVG
jgi:uncharacterized SAM-binding protein YcdF (DUF218 family)